MTSFLFIYTSFILPSCDTADSSLSEEEGEGEGGEEGREGEEDEGSEDSLIEEEQRTADLVNSK